jgi:hypothetical protein
MRVYSKLRGTQLLSLLNCATLGSGMSLRAGVRFGVSLSVLQFITLGSCFALRACA